MSNLQSARPPGPGRLEAYRRLVESRQDVTAAVEDWVEEYGRTLSLPLFPRRPVYLFTEPADVREVLLEKHDRFHPSEFRTRVLKPLESEGISTTTGDRWKRQRNRLNEGFGTERIQSYVDRFPGRIDAFADAWNDGDRIELYHQMYRLSITLLTNAVFGGVSSEDLDFVEAVEETLIAKSDLTTYPGHVPDWVPIRENREWQRKAEAFHGRMESLIDDHDASGPPDFLSVMLETDESEDAFLAREELRDNLIGLVLGQNALALALTSAWYLLAQNDDERARFHAEVDAVFEEYDSNEVVDSDLLPYTEKVFLETIRLHPPFHYIDREPKDEVEIGGYTVPETATVFVSPRITQRSADIFDDPDAFRPERWTVERRERLSMCEYYPFSRGPRGCVGESFSRAVAPVVLAHVARHVEFEHVEGNPHEHVALSVDRYPYDDAEMRVLTR